MRNAGERSPQLHIDSLRVIVPGSDAAAGHKFATELAANLAEQAGSLFTGLRNHSFRLGDVKLSVSAPSTTEASSAASSAIVRAVARAANSSRGRF